MSSFYKGHEVYSNSIAVNTRVIICGAPLRIDSYSGCMHQCAYCFSLNKSYKQKVSTDPSSNILVSNPEDIRKAYARAFQTNDDSILSKFLRSGFTAHFGGNSDPFQPCEEHLQITKEILDITNKYNQKIVFSTKGFSTYGADVRPELHAFQLSVTNLDHPEIEPGVSPIERRYEFFRELLSKGFNVGIRMQPFIPNITTLEIVKKFISIADEMGRRSQLKQFILEGLKEMHNKNNSQAALIPKEMQGGPNGAIDPNCRLLLYYPFVKYFIENKVTFSVSDNDIRYLNAKFDEQGNRSLQDCCCGDGLMGRSTEADITYCVNHNLSRAQAAAQLQKAGLFDYKIFSGFVGFGSNGFNRSNWTKFAAQTLFHVYKQPTCNASQHHPDDDAMAALLARGCDYSALGFDIGIPDIIRPE